MDKNKQWIDNLRRQAQGYERKAPEGLLDDIKKEMARRGVMTASSLPSPKDRGRARQYRLLYVAAAAVLAAVLVVTNLPKNATEQIADVVKKERTGGNQTEKTILSPGNGQTAVSSDVNGTSSKIKSLVQNIFNNIEFGGERLVAAINGQDETVGTAIGTPMIAQAETYDAAPSPETALRSSSPQAAINKTEKARRPAYWYEGGARTMTASNTGHSGFDVSIGYTGMGGNTSGAGGTYADYQTLAVPPNTLFATVRKSEIENSPEAHHDMPVKLGINVRYNVNDRWSLQSGVNYSYLSSDIYRSSNLQESTAKQKLHYISIPLSASVSLWHNKTFNVYLTAGGEAAKLVKGKADVARTVYGSSTTESNENIHEHKLQYSVFGAAGMEVKAADKLSFYVEPGLAHYFDNHSSVINIYKDKPTQFTVNVGLRINLNK